MQKSWGDWWKTFVSLIIRSFLRITLCYSWEWLLGCCFSSFSSFKILSFDEALLWRGSTHVSGICSKNLPRFFLNLFLHWWRCVSWDQYANKQLFRCLDDAEDQVFLWSWISIQYANFLLLSEVSSLLALYRIHARHVILLPPSLCWLR